MQRVVLAGTQLETMKLKVADFSTIRRSVFDVGHFLPEAFPIKPSAVNLRLNREASRLTLLSQSL